MDHYEKLYKIGDGAQGKVFRVRHRTTMKEYALKVIRCKDNQQVNFALTEIKVLMEMRHPHIVRYVDFFFDVSRKEEFAVCLVLSLCDHGDLQQRIREARQLFITNGEHSCPEEKVLKWLRQCADALAYLHSRGFVHRDVKPTNVFFSTREDVVVGDFGLAAEAGVLGRRSAVGTPYYLAPEQMLREPYDSKVDIWGLGVVFYELLTLRERPLNSESLSNPSSADSVIPQIQEMGFSLSLAQLVRRMLSRHPQDRPTPVEVGTAAVSCGASPSRAPIAFHDPLNPWYTPQRGKSGSLSPGAGVGVKKNSSVSPGFVKGRDSAGSNPCEMCQDAPATIYCSECEERFCFVCDTQNHRTQARAAHRREPLSSQSKQVHEKSSQRCAMCNLYEPTVSCMQCNESLCLRCDDKKHRSTRRKDHMRISIDLHDAPIARDQAHAPSPVPRVHHKDAEAAGHPSGTQSATDLRVPLHAHRQGKLGSGGSGSLLQKDPNEAAAPKLSAHPPKSTSMHSSGGIGGRKLRVSTDSTACGSVTATTVATAKQGPGPSTAKAGSRHPSSFMSSSSSPRHLRVPAEYPSIGLAIAAANDDDIIMIAEGGVYEETLVVNRCIHLIGEGSGQNPPQLISPRACPLILNSAFGTIRHLTIIQSKVHPVPDPLPQVSSSGANALTQRPFGVEVRRGEWVIENCSLSSAGGSCLGISGAGTNPSISDCYLSNGRQAGVFIFDDGRGVFRRNTIKNCEHTGVLLKRRANPTFIGNTIESCKETGVFCHDSEGEFIDNKIAGHLGCGIVVKGGGSPKICGNLVQNCSQAGIFCCDHSSPILERNEVLGNAKAGLLVKTMSNPVVRDNTFSLGKETGVYVFDGGLGLFEGNTIERNCNAGFLVTTDGSPVVLGNIIRDNQYEGVWICKGGAGRFEGNQLTGNVKGDKDIDADCKAKVHWSSVPVQSQPAAANMRKPIAHQAKTSTLQRTIATN